MAILSHTHWYIFFIRFGHAKAEATALEEMKLVDIEFKKHDPHKVMGNHMASCGLNIYENEDSPHDEMS